MVMAMAIQQPLLIQHIIHMVVIRTINKGKRLFIEQSLYSCYKKAVFVKFVVLEKSLKPDFSRIILGLLVYFESSSFLRMLKSRLAVEHIVFFQKKCVDSNNVLEKSL
ncbi:Uncharacterised protein [Mycobacteroides abscessus subsp. abscessus]|nr:Uncharacterised protein [Mycobacteroides abscessus subsp. abscessus]